MNNIPTLPFEMIKINYIYCFRFLNLPVELFQDIEGKKISELLGSEQVIAKNEGGIGVNDFNEMHFNTAEGFQPYLEMPSGTITTRTANVSFLDFDEQDKCTLKEPNVPKSVFLVDFSENEKDKIIHGWPAKLQRSISLSENGTGMYCLTLVLSNPTSKKDMSLCHKFYNKCPDLKLSNFLKILNFAENSSKRDMKFGIVDKTKWVTDELPREDAAPLLSWVAKDVIDFQNGLTRFCHKKRRLSKRRSIQWFGRDEDGLLSGNPSNKDDILLTNQRLEYGIWKDCGWYPSQSPYVYTEIEAKSLSDYMELISSEHKECGSQCLHGVLQNILVRVGPSGLDRWGLNSGYLHRHGANKEDNNFPNYYPMNYMHINAHFRSTIALIPPTNSIKSCHEINNSVNQYLIALHDTVQLIRSRWYYLVTEHAHIDLLIRKIEYSWNHRNTENITAAFLEVQLKLLNARMHIGKLLEIPIVYRRAASSLNELYDTLAVAFKTNEIQTNLIEKLQQTLNIYEECLRIRITEKNNRLKR
ncbi:MAG: hypothetical protein GY737_02920 [Desulfobacteraceae bacterium]|nr:hypothetical protein [Desulfobacteraceae bacterium]